MVPFDAVRSPFLQQNLMIAVNTGSSSIGPYLPALIVGTEGKPIVASTGETDPYRLAVEIQPIPYSTTITYPPEVIAFTVSTFGTRSTEKYGVCNMTSPIVAYCVNGLTEGDQVGVEAYLASLYVTKKGFGFIFNGYVSQDTTSSARLGLLTRIQDHGCAAQFVTAGASDSTMHGYDSSGHSPVYASASNTFTIRMNGYYLFGFSVTAYSSSDIGTNMKFGLYEAVAGNTGHYCEAENTGDPQNLAMSGVIKGYAGQVYTCPDDGAVGSLSATNRHFWMAYLGIVV